MFFFIFFSEFLKRSLLPRCSSKYVDVAESCYRGDSEVHENQNGKDLRSLQAAI